MYYRFTCPLHEAVTRTHQTPCRSASAGLSRLSAAVAAVGVAAAVERQRRVAVVVAVLVVAV